jgi:hypothetical protein
MVNSTWQQAAQWAGVDTSKYPTAMSAPEAVQDQVASALYDHSGTAPWQKGTRDWVAGPGGQYTLQTVQPTAPGLYSPLRGGPTQVASNAPETPPGSTLPVPPVPPAGPTPGRGFGAGAFGTAGAGATTEPQPQETANAANVPVNLPAVPSPQTTAAQAVARRTGKPALIEGTPGLYAQPNGGVTSGPTAGGLGRRTADVIQQGINTAATTVPQPSVAAAGPAVPTDGTTPPAATTAAPGRFGGAAFGTTVPAPQPAVPQPPVNQAMPGAVNGPPSPAPAQQPQFQMPPTGQQSAQYQQAMDLQRRALALEALPDPTGRAKALAGGLRQQAALILQTDSVTQVPGVGQVHTLTGAIDKPVAHYEWDPVRGSYVDTTGGSPPVTPPSPRLTQAPGGIILQSKPGGGAEVVYTPPTGTRPATGSYEQQAEAYKTDIPVVQAASNAGQQAQNSMIQLNELAGLVGSGNISSGPEGPFRSRVAAYMEQHGYAPDVIKSWTGMGSGSDAQLLQKLATATVGASAKADLGSNVGIQSLQLYQDANPGITMLDDANKRVTNMIRVSRALTDDYTTGLQSHFNANQDSFLHDKGYNEPVSVYNAKWQQQNNPQVGAAAIGILNGDDYSSWAGRLASPAEAFRAAQLVARIDPNATVKTAAGPKSVKDILAHRDAP